MHYISEWNIFSSMIFEASGCSGKYGNGSIPVGITVFYKAVCYK